MSTATSALTIECAKPDCHWRGSPADAPTHDCPTPAVINGRNETEGVEHVHDPRPSFVREREEIEARLTAAGVEFSSDLGLEELRGLAQLLVDDPPAAREPEATPDPEPQLAEPAAAAPTETPAYDSDPQTLDELGQWLAAHGAYDSNGVPSDERTATLDARYGVLVQQVSGINPDDRRDDELQVGEATDEPREGLEVPLGREAEIGPDGGRILPRPWQAAIAAALETQQEVAAYKWFVVWHPADDTRESELIGRGKKKQDAVIIQEDVIARGQLQGEIAVVKTADVIAAAETHAAEVERRRELTDEPDQAVEQPNPETPGTSGNDPEPPETPRTPEPPTKTPDALFDIDEYADPTLALPTVDGHSIDRIALTFTGEVMLDRSDKDHVALFRRIKLGQPVELWVEGRGFGFQAKPNTNRDGDLDVVVAKRAISVQHVRVMGPEDLQEAALELASQARDAEEADSARDRIPADA